MTRSTMKNGRNLLPIARLRNAMRPKGTAPVWCWFYNYNWQNNYFAWAMSESVGQVPLLSDIPVTDETPDYEGFSATGIAMRREGAEPVGSVALLFSAASRDWNEGADFRPELFGTAQALEALHIPYRFVSDQDLENGLSPDYAVLFLGDAQCLSDAAVAGIRAFAARGGRVRLSGRAGSRNELGLLRQRSAFEDAAGFSFFRTPRAASFELDENWIDLKWSFNPDPAAEAAFRAEVLDWAVSAGIWRIEAPDKVFTSVWRERDGAYVVHFLNGTGVAMKPGDAVTPDAPDPAFPPVAEAMTITAPESAGTVAAAYSPEFSGARIVPVSANDDGTVTAKLSPAMLKGYLLVRFGETVK